VSLATTLSPFYIHLHSIIIMADNRSRDPQWALLRQQQSSRGLFSPEIIDLVLPPLKFGGYAGELLPLLPPRTSHTDFEQGLPVFWQVSGVPYSKKQIL
jgi:hypothetical protein